VADHELLVLSRPPAGVTDEEYDDWYETHVREVLALPSFVAAHRLRLDFVSATSEPAERYTFLTRYEITGPFEAAWQQLRTAVDGGQMTFEDWFGGVESQGWQCTPIGGRIESRAPVGRG
jgi:hypothetical protein